MNPTTPVSMNVINPANEEVCGRISVGNQADVDKAAASAREALSDFSQSTRDERIALLEKILEVYQSRHQDIADAITLEMGAPKGFSTEAQAACGMAHFTSALEALKSFNFEDSLGSTQIFREPIGVCGLITPWNWPINQIACKSAPAIAVGCTMVHKPSEIAPLSSCILAEVFDAAGIPPGVYNMVNGDGPGVVQAIASHPGIDMVSFTGSTRAGRLVAKAASDSIKRVTQELGGKSPNILLDDVDFEKVVTEGVTSCFKNTGQSCNAPTRMLVPVDRHDEALGYAKSAAESCTPGDPHDEKTVMGPVVSEIQFNKIQGLIQKGIDEGATLVTGGTGRPEGLEKGYYVKPTIFGGANNNMTIAREEVFGPVITIIPYGTEEEAIEIANDTPYGLSSYIQSGNANRGKEMAGKLQTGMVHLNGAPVDFSAPFGGYKQSGNGREWGAHGFEDYLETKAVMGYRKG